MQYARNLANTVYESIKRVVPWSSYYFTHDKSYYPVLRQSTPLNAIPKLEHLKARRELNRQEKDLMIEWATNNGRAARQCDVEGVTVLTVVAEVTVSSSTVLGLNETLSLG